MLKSISLENYKCFKEKTDIEIAPLTVLCGVNSSGKSSILKSLLMLKQTAESKLADPTLLLSGDLVDCGSFDSAINTLNRQKNTFDIVNKFEIYNHTLDTTGKYVKKRDAEEFNELKRIYECINTTIVRFIFKIKITVEKHVDSNNEFSPYLSNNRIKFYSIDINVEGKDGLLEEYTGKITFGWHPQNEKEEKGLTEPHLLSWENIPYLNKRKINNKQTGHFTNYKCACTFNGLAISNIFAYDMKYYIKNVVPNILAITRIISNQFNGINYIAPLRNTPERTYLINKNVNSVGVTGENAPILLAKYKNKKIRTDIFCPLVNKFDIDNDGYVTARFEEIIQQWLTYFQLGNLNIIGDANGTVSLNLNNQNIVDVGFGASQILPIIIQGIFMDKEQTLLIEQPEIHLHPRMELQMADFLVTLAQTGRNVIIETHSEHIKTRLIRRIIEDDSRKLKDKINIYFITQEEMYNSKSISIIFDDEYGILENPKEFFDQGASEQFALMKAGVIKREKIKDNIV